MRSLLLFGVSALTVLWAFGCPELDDTEFCDETAIQDALDKASESDVVRLGACRVTGNLTVPPGITLAGTVEEDGESVVESTEGVAIMVSSGAVPGRVEDLTVVSGGSVGILVEGESGAVELARVVIRPAKGIGLSVEDIDSVTISDVTIAGPITPENVGSFQWENRDPDDEHSTMVLDPDIAATHGLVIIGVGQGSPADEPGANLSNVAISGFGMFGAVLVNSNTRWVGGGVQDTSSTGLMIHGGRASLEAVELRDVFHSGQSPVPAYCGVIAAEADVGTEGLTISGCARYGILHDNASAVHVNVTAEDNQDVALWAQGCHELEVSGASTMISGNAHAGIVVRETDIVTIVDAHVESTLERQIRVGETGHAVVGDGIQLIDIDGSVLLGDLTLLNNARVGLLIDTTFEPETWDLSSIVVEGSGAQLGAVAQGQGIPSDWDSEIERRGETVSNDESPPTLMMKGVLSAEQQPDVSFLGNEGIAGVIGDAS